MGYTTEFDGKFKLNKTLSPVMKAYLYAFAGTRRMERKELFEEDKPFFGEEGELFCFEYEDSGQRKSHGISEYNTPPSTQPGLWCKWVPSECGNYIEWDGREKFTSYIQWLEYMIEKLLAPDGYILNGEVKYQGEDINDRGIIKVIDNRVVNRYLE